MIDLTTLTEAIIGLVITVITCYLVPLIKKKLTKEEQENLQYWVDIAVRAAEQMIKGDKKGKEKKQYVINYLEKKGFTIDADKVELLIESAVYKMNNEDKAEVITGV